MPAAHAKPLLLTALTCLAAGAAWRVCASSTAAPEAEAWSAPPAREAASRDAPSASMVGPQLRPARAMRRSDGRGWVDLAELTFPLSDRDLERLIKREVLPAAWLEGTGNLLEVRDGVMTLRGTPRVLRAVELFLADLRAQLARERLLARVETDGV